MLEFAGTSISLDRPELKEGDDLEDVRILRSESLPGLPDVSTDPNSGFDVNDLPESTTLLVHAGGDLGPTPVSEGRWRRRNGVILIDEVMGFADEEVGAPITHAGTGALLGVLILDPEGVRVGGLRTGVVN